MKNNKRAKLAKDVDKYDDFDVSTYIDSTKNLKFEDLGLKLPDTSPTQVVLLRLPTKLLNEIKAIGSQKDVPYQALIKLMLLSSIAKYKK